MQQDALRVRTRVCVEGFAPREIVEEIAAPGLASRVQSPSPMRFCLLAVASLALSGCGLLSEPDGLTPDDFAHDGTGVQTPEQNEAAVKHGAVTDMDSTEPPPELRARALDLAEILESAQARRVPR